MEQLNNKKQQRLNWAADRAEMETGTYKHLRYGKKFKRKWSLFDFMVKIFGMLLKRTPLYKRGYNNARNIILNEIDLHFANLPAAFDGYSILHMTDLHLDSLPGIDKKICEAIRNTHVDVCVLTGDFREKTDGTFNKIIEPLQQIVNAIRHRDGIYATLGNHDTCQMVEPFEKTGLSLLINETITITRGNSRISITGLDDPHYYYTEKSLETLEASGDGFKVALVHTPSLFDLASENAYSLYLTGHTHGGQICLPGGFPVIRHLRHGRQFYRGIWRFNKMTGYTGQGVGVVGIPVRFNTQSEITILTLHTKKD